MEATPYAVAESFLPRGLADVAPARLCDRLARTHYENFTVGSVLLPKALRQHIRNIYAYCRVCDDMADETGDPQLSIKLLEWWLDELRACYDGSPRHPVFCALRQTISRFDLPMGHFEDLISAFVQDQFVTRYETFDHLLGYCERSANPVGRLLLCLLGYRDEPRIRMADRTCTALQLANFWQDIASDYHCRGRVYIPLEDMKSFGYTEAELRNGIVNTAFVRLMRFEIERTREFFAAGAPLRERIEGPGATDVALFTMGGMSLLRAIERRRYDVFHGRITVPSLAKCAFIVSHCAGWFARSARFGGSAG